MGTSFEMQDFILWGCVSALLYYVLIHKSRRDKMLTVFKGPRRPLFIGHVPDFIFTKKEDILAMMIKWLEQYNFTVNIWYFNKRFVVTSNANIIEKVLTSTQHLRKGADYDFIQPWLGNGLLLTEGQQWSHQRKMLTPSFHFKILEDFVPVFNVESLKLVKLLKEKYGKGKSFDFEPWIKHCTLDIICKTAMGKSLNAMEGENSEYSDAVREIGMLVLDRAYSPWLQVDFLWRLSPLFKKHEEILKTLHGFTDSVIQERKLIRKNMGKSEDSQEKNSDEESIYFGKVKKKKAFLDLLLDVQEENGTDQLSDQEIRNQTDTFMFAGHDTTSVSIMYSVFALGAYPEIQENVAEEMETIFGNDKDRPVTTEDIAKMKYLDCVIKETMRVYPSVPSIQRYLTSDLKIDENITIPSDVTVMLFIYGLHKNPNYFPDPDVFRPERFLEGDSGRFNFLPFSAGPRNCIGQKFANLEQKVILANIVRNFKIKSVQDPKDLQLIAEITIRTPGGILVELNPR